MANQSLNGSTPSLGQCQNQTSRIDVFSASIYTLLGIRIVLSFCVFVSNLKLLCLQRKAQIWFEADRPLILGILVSNMIGATSVILNGLSRFAGLIFNLKLSSQNSHLAWLIIISDASMFSLILYIAAITLRNYIGIRYFYQTDNRYSMGRAELTTLSILIMAIALTLSFFGLNSHGQAIINETNFAMDVGFFLGSAIIQLATAFTLYKLKVLSQKMQDDFALNQVQQDLQLRVILRRAIERTRALIPLCTINVVVWIALWTADFIIDLTLPGHQASADCTQRQPESIIWLSIMDITGSVYGLLYPHMLTRRKEPIVTRIRKTICCVFELTEVSTSHHSPQSVAIGRKKPNHWAALDAQWNSVERSMKAHQPHRATTPA